MEGFLLVFILITIFIIGSYSLLGIISSYTMVEYIKKNDHLDYHPILSFHKTIPVSLIAPAHNEGKNIIDNVRSLLNINYNNFEIIVVNDGSSDNTLELLIEEFELYLVDHDLNDSELETQYINGVYHSAKKAFSRLRVIDKQNGGKSDAMNAGINLSTSPYFICIDVDCVIDTNAILKLVKPFVEQTDKKVIATGGVVRIANSCDIEYGKIKAVNVPSHWIARSQVLEYLRAFLLGRMAWAKMDGLLIISGAFGMFDKALVKEVGGYDTKTVGEDVELVVRMRRYCTEQKVPYTVKFIPDPLCYTEVPESISVFLKQRSRWTRGMIETLWKHRIMAFNPKYKILGLVSFPYWILFEFLAPIVEFIGIIFTVYLFFTGQLNTEFFFLLLGISYLFGVGFNLSAILTDDTSFQQYKGFKQVFRLIFTSIIDPLIFHPLNVFATLRGHIHKIMGRKNWGNMERKGFIREHKKAS